MLMNCAKMALNAECAYLDAKEAKPRYKSYGIYDTQIFRS